MDQAHIRTTAHHHPLNSTSLLPPTLRLEIEGVEASNHSQES